MIQPVSQNPYQNTPSVNKKNVSMNGQESGFSSSLQQKSEDNQGVIYEPTHAAPYEKSSGFHQASKSPESEISSLPNDDQMISDSDKQEPHAITEAISIFQSLSHFFQNIISTIVKVFGNIWESKPIGDGVQNNLFSDTSKEAEKAQDSLSNIASSDEYAEFDVSYADAFSTENQDTDKASDTAILEALKDGDGASFRQLISENGTKKPARNSGLLTFYNSRGQIVQINPSDEQRILRGDYGSRKT